jgi:uncharacterized protein
MVYVRMLMIMHRYYALVAFLLLVLLAGCRDDVQHAVQKGDVQMLERLISEGRDINKKDREGKTPIFRAIEHNDAAIVQVLIKNGADLKVQDKYIATPLHYAANLGETGIVKMLLDSGANVNAVSERNNFTPLCYAVRAGRLETTVVLLGHGADISVRPGSYGRTLLHLSVINLKNPVEMTEALLAAGLDVNIVDNKGRTPLHAVACALAGSAIAAEVLVRNGANPALRDNDGMTALDYAKNKNHTELIQVLESYTTKN